MRLCRSRGLALGLAALSGMAAANLVAWALSVADAMAAWSAPVVLAAGAAVALVAGAWSWRQQSAGDLAWDGGRWQWGGLEGDVQVAMDAGDWLLLRFDALSGGRRWVAASRHACTGPWAALRAALYCRRPAGPSDAPPA